MHIFLQTTSQGVTGTLSVSLGLYDEVNTLRPNIGKRTDQEPNTINLIHTFAASTSASPSTRCCLPAEASERKSAYVTIMRLAKCSCCQTNLPSAAHWSDTSPPTFSLMEPAVDLALPPAYKASNPFRSFASSQKVKDRAAADHAYPAWLGTGHIADA